jgi:hypothetical protein
MNKQLIQRAVAQMTARLEEQKLLESVAKAKAEAERKDKTKRTPIDIGIRKSVNKMGVPCRGFDHPDFHP